MLLLRLSTSVMYGLLTVLTFIWGALVFDLEVIAIPVTEFCSQIADGFYTRLVEMPASTNDMVEFVDE